MGDSQVNTVSGGGSNYAVQGGNINFAHKAPPEKIRILMLAANPHSTARLAIDEEARQIAERLRLSQDRDAFDLITCWAVRPGDLLQQLNQHRPHIVHVSGHGGRDGGIVLAAGDGSHRSVSAGALGDLFKVCGDEVRVVVLNACHSAAQVRAIGRHVDYVVGMRAAVTDDAATVFAAFFYSALGFGRPVPEAFEQAVTALRLHGLAGHDIPELVVRPRADPHLTARGGAT